MLRTIRPGDLRRHGLGLLEVMMALIILSVAITGSFYVFPSVANALNLSRHYLFASHLCRQQLEQIVQEPFASISPATLTSVNPTVTCSPTAGRTSTLTFINNGAPDQEPFISITTISSPSGVP